MTVRDKHLLLRCSLVKDTCSTPLHVYTCYKSSARTVFARAFQIGEQRRRSYTALPVIDCLSHGVNDRAAAR